MVYDRAYSEDAFGDVVETYNSAMDWNRDWSRLREGIGEFVHGLALSGYEKNLRHQFLELNDLFLLLCFMETVGLPNPATIYLLEIYPYFLDEFHAWHRRMGMDRSPLDNLPCC